MPQSQVSQEFLRLADVIIDDRKTDPNYIRACEKYRGDDNFKKMVDDNVKERGEEKNSAGERKDIIKHRLEMIKGFDKNTNTNTNTKEFDRYKESLTSAGKDYEGKQPYSRSTQETYVRDFRTKPHVLPAQITSDGRHQFNKSPSKENVRAQPVSNATMLPTPISKSSWSKSILSVLKFDKNMFEKNAESALSQIKLGCMELSHSKLTSQQMNDQLDYLKGFIDASKHSKEDKAKMNNWVNTLRGMEMAKTSFESQKHSNLGSDAGWGVQKDMLSRRFDSMLTRQNGDYSSRLTNTQYELMGSRYQIGEGLKADTSQSGKAIGSITPEKDLRRRIANNRDRHGDFESHHSAGKFRERVARFRAKAEVSLGDYSRGFSGQIVSMADLIKGNTGNRGGGSRY